MLNCKFFVPLLSLASHNDQIGNNRSVAYSGEDWPIFVSFVFVLRKIVIFERLPTCQMYHNSYAWQARLERSDDPCLPDG